MLDEGTYKIYIQNMHNIDWKAQYFNSTYVSILVLGCGVSQYPQFCERIKKIYQMLTCPYVASFSVLKGHQFLQNKSVFELAKSVETFVIVSISDMPSIKYWKNLGLIMDTEKGNTPKQCSIGDICFTSLATIGGNLLMRHPKNLNHVHKYSNDILSVIIILGRYFHDVETIFLWND